MPSPFMYSARGAPGRCAGTSRQSPYDPDRTPRGSSTVLMRPEPPAPQAGKALPLATRIGGLRSAVRLPHCDQAKELQALPARSLTPPKTFSAARVDDSVSLLSSLSPKFRPLPLPTMTAYDTFPPVADRQASRTPAHRHRGNAPTPLIKPVQPESLAARACGPLFGV